MVSADPASAALRISSVAMVLMVTEGAVASTLYACVAWALLPATLLTLAWTFAAPSGKVARSAAGIVSPQVPPVATVVV